MKRPTYRVEIHEADENACVEALTRVPRGCSVYAPLPDGYRNFVMRVRGRAYKHGIVVHSERTKDERLRLWAFDRPPRYSPHNEGEI